MAIKKKLTGSLDVKKSINHWLLKFQEINQRKAHALCLSPGHSLLITTEMGHSGDLTPEPTLCVCSYAQRFFAGSNVDVMSYYCLISILAGSLAVVIQAICALVVLPVFRPPRRGPRPKKVKSNSQQSKSAAEPLHVELWPVKFG